MSDSLQPNHKVPDWLDAAGLLLKYRRVFTLAPIGLAILLVGVKLVLPKTYTTTLSFTSVSTLGSAGSLASLAGQFGLNIGLDPAVSPDYYATVLSTRELLEPLATARTYHATVDGDTVSGTLISLYDIEESDSGRTVSEALKVLSEKILTIGVDHRTGIVSVDVKTKWPEVSFQLANAILARLEEFNFEGRQRQSGSERQFLEGRLDSAKIELRIAEDSLQRFLAKNRSWEGDPALVFEQERLRRILTLRSDVFSTLTQGYEQARIAAVRNTPSLNIVEQPRLAFRFDRRHLVGMGTIGIALGLVVGVVWLVWREASARARQNDADRLDEVLALWRATIRELRTVVLRRKELP